MKQILSISFVAGLAMAAPAGAQVTPDVPARIGPPVPLGPMSIGPGPIGPGPIGPGPIGSGPIGPGPIGPGPVGLGPIGPGPIGIGPSGPPGALRTSRIASASAPTGSANRKNASFSGRRPSAIAKRSSMKMATTPSMKDDGTARSPTSRVSLT